MKRYANAAAARRLSRHCAHRCEAASQSFLSSTTAQCGPSSHARPLSSAASSSASSSAPAPPPPSAGSAARNATLDGILRVDHAGEYGAQCIYDGQLAALRLRAALSAPSSPFAVLAAALQSAPEPPSSQSHIERSIRVVDAMRLQEAEHLIALSALVPRHRCRPTALLPLWRVAGFALGYGTALLGTRPAMACTVAVEEVITEHYNDQLRTLGGDEWKEPGERWDEARLAELAELRALIRKNRDDEEQHRDVGIEHEAEQTPLYSLLTTAIKAGCQAAIAVAKKV